MISIPCFLSFPECVLSVFEQYAVDLVYIAFSVASAFLLLLYIIRRLTAPLFDSSFYLILTHFTPPFICRAVSYSNILGAFMDEMVARQATF